MGQLLHANAKTTHIIRKEIQESEESIVKIAKKYNINPSTVNRWRKADSTFDKRSGPKNPKSALSDLDQQILCEFRRISRLSMEDILWILKEKMPNLTRGNLQRCLVRHGLNILPQEEEHKARKKQNFKDYLPGFLHIDITEIRIEDQKLYLFVAIDRATRYVFSEIYEEMTQKNATDFLSKVIIDCPFKITKILTDNGAQFTYNLLADHLKPKEKAHPFEQICYENNIEHRTTQFRHPWTNGMVEIRNKIIKNATVKQFYYETKEQLCKHLSAFLLYYNLQKPLHCLKRRSPYQKMLEYYTSHNNLFTENPADKIMGCNI